MIKKLRSLALSFWRGYTNMATVADLFNSSVGDDQKVTADKAKLAADTAADQAALDSDTLLTNDAHSKLVAAVIASGPVVISQNNGTFIGLIPQPDGTVTQTLFKDGSLNI